MEPKPQALKVRAEGIPAELRNRPRWVSWKYEPEDKRWKKTPVNCKTGRLCDVKKPESWSDFETALAYYQKAENLDGVGFVFTREDDLCGVDLDKCRDAKGRLLLWAWDLLKRLPTYSEISPSGTGIKLFVQGNPPGPRCRRGNVEMYENGRFFTVTGHRFTPAGIVNCQEELTKVYQLVFDEANKWPAAADAIFSYNGLSDEAVVNRAVNAKNSNKFGMLWKGIWHGVGYATHSEADLALCRLLAFWVGPDIDRVGRLFRQSGLADRVKSQEREDYVSRTAKRAVDDQGENYYIPEMFTSGTKLTQLIQANPRYQYTVQTDLREGQSATGDDVCLPDKGFGKVEECKQGKAMAIELSRSPKGLLPNWEAAFALAKRLRVLTTDNPEQFKETIEVFCELTNRPFEEFYLEFLFTWGKVKKTEAEDAITWAHEQSQKTPYQPSPCFTPLYGQVASIAWHLHQLRGGRPIWLPRPKLASLLRTNHMTISRIVSLMMKQGGLLRCVEENYSFKNGKAKEYVFIERQPVVASSPTENNEPSPVR